MNRHTQAIVLSQRFFRYVKETPVDKNGRVEAQGSYKKAVIQDAYACLFSNQSYETIRQTLETSRSGDTMYYNPTDYLSRHLDFVKYDIEGPPDNAVSIGQFYIHPQLQESPPGPQYVMDYQTMEMTRTAPEAFFLEIKEHFTVQDVLHYYYLQHDQDTPYNEKADYTAVAHLLGKYPLDMVMYLIDASAEHHREEEGGGAAKPAFVTDYYDRALAMYRNRMTISKEGGLTRVYPRTTYIQ